MAIILIIQMFDPVVRHDSMDFNARYNNPCDSHNYLCYNSYCNNSAHAHDSIYSNHLIMKKYIETIVFNTVQGVLI